MDKFYETKQYSDIKKILIGKKLHQKTIDDVIMKFEIWENANGNKHLSFLNKKIHLFLEIKKTFSEIKWENEKIIVDLVLSDCKIIGDKTQIKENNQITDVEIVDRGITDDGAVRYKFRRKDNSILNWDFYE